MMNRLIKNSFALSLLLHFLLLLSLISYIRLQPVEYKKKPDLFSPAYVYTGAVTPAFSSASSSASSSQSLPAVRRPAMTHAAPAMRQKSVQPRKTIAAKNDGIGLSQIMASSYQFLEENQRQAIHAMVRNTEPIYMIGDINADADPLIILLGRALSKHFEYPEIAGKFGITGRVLVRLTLQPEGNITNAMMVNSSDNHDLDSAALYAVNKADIIKDAKKYINKPKTVVIGFVFRASY